MSSCLQAEIPEAPEWSLPGSATHKQVPPPAGFQRASVHFAAPIGLFGGHSDIGGPLVPGAAAYDAASGLYTVDSAGYNIWYFRDEFRFLWKRVSGDVSLAADIAFPREDGYADRKAVLVLRQDLDDNAKEVMAGLHGAGFVHLALRPEKGANLTAPQRFQVGSMKNRSIRVGIEKRGDAFAIFVSLEGEPMHQLGEPQHLPFDGPFYVGIGFCSHLPVTSDRAVFGKVTLTDL